MIVISLIGLFFVATSYLNRDARIYQFRAERLADYIYDTIRTSRNNMVIWRGVLSGWTDRIIATQRDILITSTGITTIYHTGSNGTGLETELPQSFFDSDNLYIVSDISVSSWWMNNGIIPTWDLTGATMATISMFSTGMQIATVPVAVSPRTLMITAWYAGFKRSVLVDRVTGTIETKVSGETNQ